MVFQRITDPIDGHPRWYWKHPDNVPRERVWYGPFPSEHAAKQHAKLYEGSFR